MFEFICDDILNIIVGNLTPDDIAQLRFSYINMRKFAFLNRLDGIIAQNGHDLAELYHIDYLEPKDIDIQFDDDFPLWDGDIEKDDDYYYDEDEYKYSYSYEY